MNVTGSVSQEIKDAAKFFGLKLMDARVCRHLHLDIEIDGNFGFAGVVQVDDDDPKPKFFTIKINPFAHDHLLQCLAHEMVHVAQYATGQLFDMMDGQILWEGQKYRGVVAYGENGAGLEDYPWEEEAYRLEEELYEDWLAIEIE